jgi:hypothetical protein
MSTGGNELLPELPAPERDRAAENPLFLATAPNGATKSMVKRAVASEVWSWVWL